MRLSVTYFLLAFALGGCSSPPGPSAPQSVAVKVAPTAPQPVWVARQSRYTLVELSPELAQQDLLLQVIDLRLPNGSSTTVGDALRYVLRHSGYQLCAGSSDAQGLFALPLPAAHLQLGPMVLRSALLTLAGPGWTLQVDDLSRHLCFIKDSAPEQEPHHEAP
ncbi:PilL N-terminal domain-containing protein [Pseudomonas sp. NPDC089422]|uniref:PFGI-1 class ICE element type IV pilus protein PilL2 n=1 Tax=Pseudomonas sp. NPDC089422 TaxID=3364466 RepID=UPI00382B659B